jgi:DNA repair exonuclease SbcCD ATPase subunit
MNFKSLIKRAEDVDKEFQEFQSDLAEAFEDVLADDGQAPSEDGVAAGQELVGSDDNPPAEEPSGTATSRLTPHTQTRLAALEAVAGLFRDGQGHLQEIEARLAEIATAHHMTREVLNVFHRDVLRSNELELANLALTTEHKTLSEQLLDAARKQRERDGAAEAWQQREASLVQDREQLRSALAAVRLELVEMGSESARRETEFGEIVKALTAKTVEVDRRGAENKLLREKQVGLSVDLEQAQKREAEARHKFDEFAATHASETVRIAELMAQVGNHEKEETRLQKTLEATQARLAETAEAARIAESDGAAELARGQAEMRGLRSEIQELQSRLDRVSTDNGEATAEITRLKALLNDAVTERQIAEQRLAVLKEESEVDKKNLSAVSTNLSQLSLQQTSEQIQLDIQKQECEDLHAEIEALNARIRELLPYERLHRVTDARSRKDATPPANGIITETARPAPRRVPRRNLRANAG